MTSPVRLSARVYGCVQGVCFRYFVQEAAQSLGLCGYVRNLEGGNAIEVEAEGEEHKLQDLVRQLKAGPPLAQVKEIELSWSDYSGQFTDFRVRY
ncbi:MAG: acylphosphatase [Chloroflexota bacterium]|nr:acylphosphatase [Chloroflexota bacterium]